MGEEEAVTKAPVGLENGAGEPEKCGGTVADKKEEDIQVAAPGDGKIEKEEAGADKIEVDPLEKENRENIEACIEANEKEENAAGNDNGKEETKTEAHEKSNGPEGIEVMEENKKVDDEKADNLQDDQMLDKEEKDGEEEKQDKGAGGDGGEEKQVEEEEEGGEEKLDREEEGEEKLDKEEAGEEEQEEVEKKAVKGLKKRVRGKAGEEKKIGVRKAEKKKKIAQDKKEPEPRTPAIERPQRERKFVERLVASIERDASKEFRIAKGRGIPLKDIPNVAFKISRRKIDDSLKLLHTILFGRRGKAIQVKSNIMRFSGFDWRENEEKQMLKVKEKFDKCNKEKLLEFCDLFDVAIAKASTKKEDIISKLIDFLVSPHATTDVLLAEKEKGDKSNKRKRLSTGSASFKRSAKSQKKADNASNKSKKKPDNDDESEEVKEEEEDEEEEVEKQEEEVEDEGEKEEDTEEDNDNELPEKPDAEMPEPSESEEKDDSEESEEESEEDTKKKKAKRSSSSKKGSAVKPKTNKTPASKKTSASPKRIPKRSSSKRNKVDDDSDATPKASSKKRESVSATKKSSSPAKSVARGRSGKKDAKAKEKAPAKEKSSRPSDKELRDAICEILKEVDFNTATFTDILKLLAKRYDMDLTPRKSSIKVMIQEELTKLADEVEEEDGEAGADKDGNQAAGEEVEA